MKKPPKVMWVVSESGHVFDEEEDLILNDVQQCLLWFATRELARKYVKARKSSGDGTEFSISKYSLSDKTLLSPYAKTKHVTEGKLPLDIWVAFTNQEEYLSGSFLWFLTEGDLLRWIKFNDNLNLLIPESFLYGSMF